MRKVFSNPLRHPRRDSALISLAGPASNIMFAVICAILIRIMGPYSILFFYPIISLNVVLAVFNLVPIHPLDGGKIFVGLLPRDQAREADYFLRRFGPIILFFLIFPTSGGTSPVFMALSPVINLVLKLLLPGLGAF